MCCLASGWRQRTAGASAATPGGLTAAGGYDAASGQHSVASQAKPVAVHVGTAAGASAGAPAVPVAATWIVAGGEYAAGRRCFMAVVGLVVLARAGVVDAGGLQFQSTRLQPRQVVDVSLCNVENRFYAPEAHIMYLTVVS